MANDEIQPMLDAIGFTEDTGVNEALDYSIREFSLSPNYPNPFNAGTVIRFALPESLPVTLEVYNTLGVKVRTLVKDEKMTAGRHGISFHGEDLPSGTYFYKLVTDRISKTGKMVLIR